MFRLTVRLPNRPNLFSTALQRMHTISQRHGQWKTVSPHYDVFDPKLEQPELDDRQYRLIRLTNGMEALLIHDKTSDTSAAALDVAVGHLNDPDDMPGLAHFCEHMLFLGTKNFPKENGYNEYISAKGGHTNAFTAPHNTNYYFSVSSTEFASPPASGTATPQSLDSVTSSSSSTIRPSSLPHALKMFASFFYCPLFTEEGTARELRAVDSEHKKNSQSDDWRIQQLSKGTSRPGHPWNKFGTGDKNSLSAYGRAVTARREQEAKKQNGGPILTPNGAANGDVNAVANNNTNGHAITVDTLIVDPANPLPALESESDPDGGPVGRETRRRLMEWWEKEYCAGRMKLAILGRESLDELTDLTVKLFSPIPNRGAEPAPIITTYPLGLEQLGKIMHVKTVMDFRGIDITFQVPWQTPLYRTKPVSFLSHFVGHEGPGSVHSYLKEKGWITGLSAGGASFGRGFGRFGIYISLTKEGLKHHEAVILATYKYIALLRTSVLEKYHHDEIRALRDINFRFAEKSHADNYVSHLSETMNKPYEREHIISGPARVWEWNEKEVQDLLDDFRPANSRVMLLARDWEENSSDDKAVWQKDKWYDTEYRVLPLSKKLLEPQAEKCDIKELSLPGPNAFIPSKLEVQKIEGIVPTKAPTKIRNTPLSMLWYKKDDQFWVPRANFNIYLITPLSTLTPRHALKSRIYTSLVNDALTEYAYIASLAGLDYRFSSYDKGVFFSASGYNERLSLLVEKVLYTMKNKKLNPGRFKVLMEDLNLAYKNFYLMQPYKVADYWLGYLLCDSAWTPQECMDEMDTLTVEEVEAHRDQLLDRVYIEGLSHGNIREEEATGLLDLTEKFLGSHPVTPSEKHSERSLILPEGSNFVYKLDIPNPKEINSSITYYCHVGSVANRKLTARTGMLLQMIREPAFDELRTKQQLGYIVSTSRYEARGFMGVKIIIQSEREPIYLESRVDAFLEAYRSQLAATTPEEFQKQKDGLISAKLEKLENLISEARRFWTQISNGYCDFTRQEKEVVELQNITLEDVINFFDKYVLPSSLSRRKLSVHLRSQIVPSKPSTRFSVAASEAYLNLLKTHKIPVEEEQYRTLSKAEPPVDAVKTFWTDLLAKSSNIDDALRQTLLESIKELADTNPVQEAQPDVEVALREGTVIIDDVALFKASLPMGPAAVPIQDMIIPLPRL